MVKLDQDIINGFHCADQDNFWSIFTQYSSALRIGKNKEGLEMHLADTSFTVEESHEPFLSAVEYSVISGFDPVIMVSSEFLYGDKLAKSTKKLRERLLKLSDLKTEHSSLFGIDNLDITYLNLLIQNTGFEDYSKTVKHFLQFNNWNAVLSTVDHEPNYFIQTDRLVECIEDLLEEKLNLGYYPKIIEGYVKDFTQTRSIVGPKDKYVLAITQKNGCPFTFNTEMGNLVERIDQELDNPLEKSKALFEWIRENISYDKEQREAVVEEKPHIYRSALQTFQDRKGVCGEQIFLYATLCRLIGIKTNYATIPQEEVARMNSLKNIPKLNHACAILFFPGGRSILVDTGREDGFDIKYKKFYVRTDESTCVGYHNF